MEGHSLVACMSVMHGELVKLIVVAGVELID